MATATKLPDIAEITRTVEFGNNAKVTVFGISAEGFAVLMARFPQIERAMQGMGITRDEIMSLAPEAIGAFLAAGLDMAGNKEAEDKLRAYPMSVQLDIAEAIIELTFPGGFGPFVDRLRALMGEAAQVASQHQPPSAATSKNSSQAATPKPGATPQSA
jgi:hypothetical protein